VATGCNALVTFTSNYTFTEISQLKAEQKPSISVLTSWSKINTHMKEIINKYRFWKAKELWK